MAKKHAVNKSQTVRDYLKDHAGAANKEVADALTKQGVKMTPNYVAAVKGTRGQILDTFVFAEPRRTLELNPPESERLQDLIRRVALGKTDARRLLRNRTRLDPKHLVVEPQVQFVSDACETATLVEIVTEDRPGLLYSLASVFSSNACNIDIVLIDTRGRRAIDVFYVAQDGGRLSPAVQAKLKEQLLSACLGA